jgi:Predicted membrane protein
VIGMLLSGYLKIMLSSVTVYVFIVLAIRIFGKKELAQLSVIDLVFILLISNAVQNAMVGEDSSLLGGLIAAASLFIVNHVFKLVLYHFPGLSRLIQGEPLMLIYNGKLNMDNIRKSKITVREIMEAIREHGVSTIEEVDLAVLEVDGNISILSNEFTHKTMRRRKARKTMTKKDGQ